jgi:hypothetical protein
MGGQLLYVWKSKGILDILLKKQIIQGRLSYVGVTNNPWLLVA